MAQISALPYHYRESRITMLGKYLKRVLILYSSGHHQLMLSLAVKHFYHREVRDLAWALFQPSFFQHLPNLKPSCLQRDYIDEKVNDWLQALDKAPHHLFEHLKGQRATRLGIYFEQLLSFYFAYYPRFSLIAKNFQINDTQRTIGEYDFIVLDHTTKQHLHIEVAVKFYIGLNPLDIDIPNNTPTYDWHHWVGPNKKDSLAIKMNHLCQHQLQLSEIPASITALDTLGITPTQLQTRLLLTGRLFYPLKKVDENYTNKPITRSITSPNYLNQDYEESCHWLTVSQIINNRENILIENYQHRSRQTYRYLVLPRQQWLSEILQQDLEKYELTLLHYHELIEALEPLIQKTQQHMHIAVLASNKDNKFKEKQRFFILSEE